MGYVEPTGADVSDDYNDHANRNPPSPEPGTDYACAYGTDLAMAENGTISVVDTSPGGGEGRRMSVDLDDGRRVAYIHLSEIRAGVGQRVGRGQTGVAFSGASGNGSDWYYGPHVHVTLWETPGLPYYASIDFEQYVGGGPVVTQGKDKSMWLIWYGDTGPVQGWLVCPTAQIGVENPRDYDLLKRIITSDQGAANPAHFNFAERDIIQGYLVRLAQATAGAS